LKLSQLTEQRRSKKKSRSGLGTIQFIRPRTEEDKLYGRAETKRYKELKEKLRRDKKIKMLMGENASNISDDEDDDNDERGLSRSIVDELEIYNKSKHLDKIRKIKKDVDTAKLKKKAVHLSPTEHANIKRQFRDEIKEEITKFLQSYREESCTNGRILSDDDYTSLVAKVIKVNFHKIHLIYVLSLQLTFSVLSKESKHCAQSNSLLKATDSVKAKTKEYIKKYMSKFEGSYQRKSEEQDYEIILNKI
jgi:SRI (Set2 Rpb1 interacting) domain